MFRTGAQLLLLTLLAGLILLFQAQQEPLASWDQDFADFLARNSHHRAALAPMTLVEIDDASLADHPWPWSPLDFSLYFQAVLPFKPEVVAIDEVLDWNRFALPAEQQQKLPQYEKILRDSILRAPKVLLGAHLGFPEDPTVIPPLQEVPLVKKVLGDVRDIPEFTAVEQQPSEEYRLSATIGFVNLPSARPRYNAVPLVLRYRGQVIPSFVLQAVMLWQKLTPDEISVELGSHVLLGEKVRVPIDPAGRMRVDFGTPRSAFGFDNLLLAAELVEAGQKPKVPVEQMAGGVVLLSRTEKNARDLPLAALRKGSAGELFAAAIATIQNQTFVRRVPWWGAGLVLLLVALVAYRVPRWSRLKALGAGIGVLVVFVLISLAVFSRWLFWMPIVPVVGAVLFMVLFRIVTPDSAGKPKRPVIL
jgi:CHASE2 domain-containing sensor protein